ncbi:hypothetical protein AM571_CH02115 [Rhizobium etli 8C-3]|uniref:Secreted protein n=2 Tax=Rhizobium TaxID=379 RepID=A0A4R3QHE5_9HYPH|nr:MULTISPECIES: hypothetical protein [Rhizobium]APO74925.1 hypothetical protein AM571_CH02115 [Rhizobium etli 8C-3]TCU17626.1 hypothetical protein EV130_11676 [Rhizobium azibense]TCU31709.1 hypothetical protein EV129_12576 [Rhizobium azibense]
MEKTGQNLSMLTRVVCALSLLMLGLAHQAPQAAAADADYNSAAYVLPDGTYASLCVTVNDGSDKTVPLKPSCEVCRLWAFVILPVPDYGSWLHLEFATLHNSPAVADTPIGGHAVERPKSRAPPVQA